MGNNAVSVKDDNFLESGTIKAEVIVLDYIEPKGNQTCFKIIKVIDGDAAMKGQPFWVKNKDFAEGHETYLADLEVSLGENIPITDIQCLSIMPLDTKG